MSSTIKSQGRQGRWKRSAWSKNEKFIEDDTLEGIVQEVLLDLFEQNQPIGEVNAKIKHPRSIRPLSYHLNLPTNKDEKHIHPESVYSPTITSHELHAPPGCRSIATKKCLKKPVSVPRKVPYSVCHTVPDIDCVNILRSVPEVQCTPEVSRECKDKERKVPYLVEEEECEEVTFDECVEVIIYLELVTIGICVTHFVYRLKRKFQCRSAKESVQMKNQLHYLEDQLLEKKEKSEEHQHSKGTCKVCLVCKSRLIPLSFADKSKQTSSSSSTSKSSSIGKSA